jgi:hypothetical protein
VTLSERAAAAKESLRAEIDKLVSKYLPADVKAEIRDRLTFGDLPEPAQARLGQDPARAFWGHFDAHEKIMYLSLAADNPIAVAHEEIAHMLEEAGLLPERDLQLLRIEAGRPGVRDRLKVDARYRELYAKRYQGDPDGLNGVAKIKQDVTPPLP